MREPAGYMQPELHKREQKQNRGGSKREENSQGCGAARAAGSKPRLSDRAWLRLVKGQLALHLGRKAH